MRAYTCDSIWNCHARKACAIIERSTTDACYAIRYGYARKTCATIERIITDACYAVAYGYARKAGAISNAAMPMLVTLFGIVTLVRLVQL